MTKTSGISAANRSGATVALAGLIAIYAFGRVLQVLPGKVPMTAVVALHVFPPIVFALVHGAMSYRVRGIVTFAVLCLGVGSSFENVGVLTGFPYGRYYFTDVMGPKLFFVPLMLSLAYLGMGYLSWTLARVILGGLQSPVNGWRVVTLPVVASFIMVAWDLSMDPVWGTIARAWVWQQGGAYFGVPVTNFLGWYLTVYVFYQLFALYLRKRLIDAGPLPAGYWRLAVLFYGISAAGNVLLAVVPAGASVVADPTGRQWNARDIVEVSVLVSVFVMGAFALLAWARLTNQAQGKRVAANLP